MIRLALLLALPLLAAAPAVAADRSVPVGSFDRVRVQGPYRLVVAGTRVPAVVLTGDDAAIGAVEVVLEGRTLTVRNRLGRWEEQPQAAARAAVVVTLGSDSLTGASVIGGGGIRAERMRGARVDLAVTGAGSIDVADLQADAVLASVIGTGAISVAGKAGEARLLTNGSGTIEAARLDVGDLTVRLDGPGATSARARYTAHVVDTGLGQVSVAGDPKCTVSAQAGGPVACGAASPPR